MGRWKLGRLLLGASAVVAGAGLQAWTRGSFPAVPEPQDSGGQVQADKPEITLKTAPHHARNSPIQVTVLLTNISINPELINRRFLVNHPSLTGDIYFEVVGPDGRPLLFQRLVTA